MADPLSAKKSRVTTTDRATTILRRQTFRLVQAARRDGEEAASARMAQSRSSEKEDYPLERSSSPLVVPASAAAPAREFPLEPHISKSALTSRGACWDALQLDAFE